MQVNCNVYENCQVKLASEFNLEAKTCHGDN